MKFYPQQNETDCLIASFEFLLQGQRSKFFDKLHLVHRSDSSTPLCLPYESSNSLKEVLFTTKLTSHKHKIILVRRGKEYCGHAIVQRGKRIYDPYLKKTFKSLKAYQDKMNCPIVYGCIHKK